MTNASLLNDRHLQESRATNEFLDDPNDESFATVFKTLFPQLVAFFRARSRDLTSAEDLAQDVMLTVYCKAGQIRDRALFRSWLFKIAHNVLCRHYGSLGREVETVDLAEVDNHRATATEKKAGPHAFEFRDWMTFLDERERDVMTLRFVEEWEYHEIAAARRIPIGTVQWRVFNSKKKLAKHLSAGCRVREIRGHSEEKTNG
ncbi:MAG TPA: RNA polymerase sigma factor [Bryobacteraceae bacterium]|jgi:RNA polymerase sigma-70 factor (ECF subfamily)|nr:RNA polymerase sigma factor [Bryobacteraceae bacterium]